jgi:phenylpyruvate tautomerase PptA (4-oxalocrotonate tautomerase family)
MPVYTCTTTAGTRSDDTKANIAAEITKSLSFITGAPTAFVHVTFQDPPAANLFTDSSPSHPLQITVVIRAGRAAADKIRLAKDISSSSRRLAGIPETRVLGGRKERRRRPHLRARTIYMKGSGASA